MKVRFHYSLPESGFYTVEAELAGFKFCERSGDSYEHAKEMLIRSIKRHLENPMPQDEDVEFD